MLFISGSSSSPTHVISSVSRHWAFIIPCWELCVFVHAGSQKFISHLSGISGVQRQIVHCVEKTTGIVEEHFCDPLTRPEDNQTSCNKEPCPVM